jgi:hypothetical protein
MTKLEELYAAYEATLDAYKATDIDFTVADAAAYAALVAYEAELKKQENSNE